MPAASLWAYSAEKLFLMIAKQPDRGCAAMKAPVGLSSGRTFLREQDGGALPRQVPRVWLFCFFTKISCFLCSGYSCGAGLYGFYKMHCCRIRSLLRAKREPERTAVPAGHESPSGAFKPQTGLRSKCRVFSAARSPLLSRRGRRRVAAPCVCFVPCAALASCRPLPQQLLPVSAAGRGRRRCKLGAARP